jgi:hypothetical protein
MEKRCLSNGSSGMDDLPEILIKCLSSELHFSSTTSCRLKAFLRAFIDLLQLPSSIHFVSLLYIFRINSSPDGRKFLLSMNPFLLITVATVLAAKFLDDNSYSNDTFADIVQVPLITFNEKEYRALQFLKYNIFVSVEVYNDWVRWLLFSL